MKTNDIFEYTTETGITFNAVVLNSDWDDIHNCNIYLCYGQNRIFYLTTINCWEGRNRLEISPKITKTVVEYAVLPDYDVYLKNEFLQQLK